MNVYDLCVQCLFKSDHVNSKKMWYKRHTLLMSIIYRTIGGRDGRGGPRLSISQPKDVDVDLLMEVSMAEILDMLAYFTFVPRYGFSSLLILSISFYHYCSDVSSAVLMLSYLSYFPIQSPNQSVSNYVIGPINWGMGKGLTDWLCVCICVCVCCIMWLVIGVFVYVATMASAVMAGSLFDETCGPHTRFITSCVNCCVWVRTAP